MRWLLLLILMGCSGSQVSMAAKTAAYAAALDKCYETSATMAGYELCAETVDRDFGRQRQP